MRVGLVVEPLPLKRRIRAAADPAEVETRQLDGIGRREHVRRRHLHDQHTGIEPLRVPMHTGVHPARYCVFGPDLTRQRAVQCRQLERLVNLVLGLDDAGLEHGVHQVEQNRALDHRNPLRHREVVAAAILERVVLPTPLLVVHHQVEHFRRQRPRIERKQIRDDEVERLLLVLGSDRFERQLPPRIALVRARRVLATDVFDGQVTRQVLLNVERYHGRAKTDEVVTVCDDAIFEPAVLQQVVTNRHTLGRPRQRVVAQVEEVDSRVERVHRVRVLVGAVQVLLHPRFFRDLLKLLRLPFEGICREFAVSILDYPAVDCADALAKVITLLVAVVRHVGRRVVHHRTGHADFLDDGLVVEFVVRRRTRAQEVVPQTERVTDLVRRHPRERFADVVDRQVAARRQHFAAEHRDAHEVTLQLHPLGEVAAEVPLVLEQWDFIPSNLGCPLLVGHPHLFQVRIDRHQRRARAGVAFVLLAEARDHVVLEQDVCIEDLAGTRVDLRGADGAVPRLVRRVPANRAVARGFGGVFRIFLRRRSALGDDRVFEPGRFERLLPPLHTGDHVREVLIGDGVIDVEGDRLYRLGERGVGVFLLQTPAVDVVDEPRVVVRLAEVFVHRRKVADAVVLQPRRHRLLGELADAEVDADLNVSRIWHARQIKLLRLRRAEREPRVDLYIFRVRGDPVEVGLLRIHPDGLTEHSLHEHAQSHHVGEEILVHFDENRLALVFFTVDGERGDNRLAERQVDRFFQPLVAGRPEFRAQAPDLKVVFVAVQVEHHIVQPKPAVDHVSADPLGKV